MLSTTPASGRSDGAQYSWKLDSSTASRSAGCVQHVEHRARRCCRTAGCVGPPAVSMACSIDVVVVLPLVPVTTSQRRGGP